jgi:hypothetical protein
LSAAARRAFWQAWQRRESKEQATTEALHPGETEAAREITD